MMNEKNGDSRITTGEEVDGAKIDYGGKGFIPPPGKARWEVRKAVRSKMMRPGIIGSC